MRIALFHTLPFGGAKRHTYEQVKGLFNRGHNITEYALSTADFQHFPLQKYIQKQVIFPFEEFTSGRRIIGVTPYINLIRGMSYLSSINALHQIIAHGINQANFDVVFVKDCKYTIYPFLVRHLTKNHLLECHQVIRPMREAKNRALLDCLKEIYYYPAREIYSSYFGHVVTQNLRCAQSVIVNSNFTRRVLWESYRAPSAVIHPGVDVEVFKPLHYIEDDCVLSVGAVSFHKGHHFIIESLSRIPQSIRPRFVIAANIIDQEEASLLKKMAADAGVKMDIENVSNDGQLVAMYNRAKVCVYAPYREAFGLAALEAMACAKPVIGVCEGGLQESIINGHTGYLLSRDSRIFAEKIAELLTSEHKRNAMGMNAREHVMKSWTWPQAIDNLESHLIAATRDQVKS